MRKLTIFTLLGIVALILFKIGCSDITSSSTAPKIDGIQSVLPARGGYGARVVIGGHGFEPLQKITFNGTEAVAELVNDSVIVTRVPMNATTGPIELIAKGEMLTGPVFTVDPTLNLFLSITAVNPQKAHPLDTVKISGSGFNGVDNQQKMKPNFQQGIILTEEINLGADELKKANPREDILRKPESQNAPLVEQKKATQTATSKSTTEDIVVYFNDIEGTILSKNDSLLVVVVPFGAQSGLISVVSAADTVLGPNFQVKNHSISKISPTTGIAGTEVTITGVDFSPSPQKNIVKFNGELAPVQSASEIKLVAIAPSNVSTGEVSVTINTIEKKGPVFTVQEEVKAPVVQSITPESGFIGTEVVIKGLYFSTVKSENTVKFNGMLATVQSASATEIRTHVPEGASTGPISVTTNGKTADGPVFTVQEEVKAPVVQSITPESGFVGTEVIIKGLYFSTVKSENTVKFNGMPATVQSASATEIRTHVPEGASTGSISVTTNGKTTDGPVFTVQEEVKAPVVQSITPESGFVGTEVIIKGLYFSTVKSENTVKFNGMPATVQSASATEIRTHVPEGASTGPISVTTNGKTAESATFTVVDATKTLNVQVSTANAPAGFDGYNLKVRGQPDRLLTPDGTQSYSGNLGNEVTVQLTQVPTTCTVNDDNPRTVQLSGSITNTFFVVNCETPSPEIYNITPDTGYIGMEVTISGEHFSEVPAENIVWFSGSSTGVQGNVISSSSTEIITEVPHGAETGTITVVVNNQTVEGPVFTVVRESNRLTVNIITNNASPGHDGYNLQVSGQNDRWVHPNSSETYENITDSQVIVELSDGPMNCVIVGDNPRTAPLDSETTEVDFVIDCAPEITGIEPATAHIGDTVTVSGEDFNYDASKNKFYFNGDRMPIEAVIMESNRWELKVIVPEGAVTGPVSVSSDGVSATGPVFTVLEPTKTLKVHVETTNASPDHDGYNLSVSGQANQWIAPSGVYTYTAFPSNQVTVELSDGPPLCMGGIAEGNPQQVTLSGSVTNVYFTVTCEAPSPEIYNITPDTGYIGMEVTISGEHFSEVPAENIVWFSGSSTGVQGNVISSSSTEIITEVPHGAETGTVSIEINGKWGEGPTFTVVEEPKTLNVHSTTINAQPDFDGYNLKVVDKDDRWLPPNGTVTYVGYFDSAELFVEIEGVPSYCSVAEGSSQLIALDNTVTDVYFTVTCGEPLPEIYSISPDTGYEGDEITIYGKYFSEDISQNTVYFFNNSTGEVGTIKYATSTQLVVEVPQGAQTGIVSVQVYHQMVEGPVFTVLEPTKTLKIHVETTNAPLGHDGYNLSVSGQANQWIAPNGEYDYTGLTVPQVTVELSDGPLECMVGIAETNPQLVTLSDPVTDVYFTVTCASAPIIDSISPNSGYVGDEITIYGENFSEDISQNTVYFFNNSTGEVGTIKSATSTQLVVEVPLGAQTGKVSVQVYYQMVEGPVFTILEDSKKLIVNIITNNLTLGHDGYNLQVSGRDDRWVHPNSPEIYENITESQVIVELSGGPMVCVIVGENPRTVPLDSETTEVDFVFDCVPEISTIEPTSAHVGDTITVSGYNFNYEASKNKFYFNGDSTPIEAVIVESASWELKVIVPAGAVTGAVSISSDGVSATGPVFTVLEPTKTLKIHVETTNAPLGHDGYNLSVSGQANQWIAPSGVYTYTGFTGNQVTVELSDGPLECMVGIAEANPQLVTLSDPVTDVYFTITCASAPIIDSISPNSGYVGDEITIYGENFSEDISQNTVYFFNNSTGEVGTIKSATSTQLVVEVPLGAQTGKVSVQVYYQMVEGPVFTVLESPKTLKVHVVTTNATPGHDGYNLSVSGQVDQWIAPNGEYDYTGLTVPQVTVELSDGPLECMVGIAEANPQLVTLSDPVTDVYFTITCIPPPVINSISPDSAFVGNEIAIYGENFSEVLSENKVYFNGFFGDLEGSVLSATSTQLVAEVHEHATAGPIKVSSYNQTVVGPSLYIKQPRMIDVSISTTGSGIHPSGYTLSVTGEPNRDILANQLATYYSIKRDLVEILLGDIPSNCSVAGSNPVTVFLSESKTYELVEIVVNCED